MLDLVVEGTGSLRFGCTIGFILPIVGVLLSGRRRAWLVAAGFTLIAGGVGWARFAGLWFGPPGRVVLWLCAVIGLGLLFMAVRATATTDGHDLAWLAAATLVMSMVAGWLWVPCVGEHFSEPLNSASTERFRSLWQVLAYTAGISIPLFVLAAVPYLGDAIARLRDHRTTALVGLVITAIIAVGIGTGTYSDLVVQFAPEAG